MVAYLALFFALGGVAAAATEPLLDRANSVEHRNIESGAVRGSDLAAGAVGVEKLGDPLRDEIEPLTPADGSYAGQAADGSITIDALVLGWQVVDMAVQGECTWGAEGGSFNNSGSAWTYVSRGPEGQFLSVRGEFADSATITIKTIATGSPTGPLQECASPISLKLQR